MLTDTEFDNPAIKNHIYRQEDVVDDTSQIRIKNIKDSTGNFPDE